MVPILSAKKPRWANPECTAIALDVELELEGHTDPAVFYAIPNDCEQHGRELFVRAMNGEFGPIAEYVEASIPLEHARSFVLDAVRRAAESKRANIPQSILEMNEDDASVAWQKFLAEVELERLRLTRLVSKAMSVEEIKQVCSGNVAKRLLGAGMT